MAPGLPALDRRRPSHATRAESTGITAAGTRGGTARDIAELRGARRGARLPRKRRARWLGLALLGALPAVSSSDPAAEEAVEVVASRQGFRPATLTANAGETLRLKLSSADSEHCFAVDALRVEKRIRPGRTTTVELMPDSVGRFPFYCCLEGPDSAERGTLLVSE